MVIKWGILFLLVLLSNANAVHDDESKENHFSHVRVDKGHHAAAFVVASNPGTSPVAKHRPLASGANPKPAPREFDEFDSKVEADSYSCATEFFLRKGLCTHNDGRCEKGCIKRHGDKLLNSLCERYGGTGDDEVFTNTCLCLYKCPTSA